ncbi:hypothetical protein F4808DRAFT_459957 [Astrocystis sublimbata]|nr:hypothetical protein F4808DRAFT_459957 [Astrocystis sublimbata]
MSSENSSAIPWIKHFRRYSIDDHNLPLTEESGAPFGDDSEIMKQARRLFFQHQWKFVPLEFTTANSETIDEIHDKHPPVDQILPITIEKVLHDKGARILKVLPHSASGLSPEKSIVMKCYRRDHNKNEFNNERIAYMTIINNHSRYHDYTKCFLEFHGCFLQGDNYVLLLEYADKGSLADFFATNDWLPRTAPEAREQWEDLLNLVTGLAHLHHGFTEDSKIHQDIKPPNIFVSSIPNRPGRFLFRFGDFGTTSIARKQVNGLPTGRFNGGTRVFSSPEAAHIHENVPMARTANSATDIYSLGCVWFDCAVWMVWHNRGLRDFFKKRTEAAKDRPDIRNAGYSGAFHDGDQLLTVVQECMDETSTQGGPVASVSHTVMSFIKDQMLLSDDLERLNAQQLTTRFKNQLYSFGDSSMSSFRLSGSTASNSQTLSSIPSPTMDASNNRRQWGTDDHFTSNRRRQGLEEPTLLTRPTPNPIQITDLMNDRSQSNQHSSLENQNSRAITDPAILQLANPQIPRRDTGRSQGHTINGNDYSAPQLAPWNGNSEPYAVPNTPEPPHTHGADVVLKAIRHYKNNKIPLPTWMAEVKKVLQNRDILFCVDDSPSMGPHWKDVTRIAEALFEFTREIDPDGVDIYMTSGAEKRKQKRSDALFGSSQFFETHSPRSTNRPCNMEKALEDILDRCISREPRTFISLTKIVKGIRKMRGISVFVFTNGVWLTPDTDTNAGNVDSVILTIIDRLKSQGYYRDHLAIQFIRFGEDTTGMSRMQFLDDRLKGVRTDWDIVDTVPWNGSMNKILIGALDHTVDKDLGLSDI